jgi:expansin (peptidoglycan-binding protein)
VIRKRLWVGIAECPWVTGSLLSVATPLVFFGLIAAAQPGGTPPPVADSSSLVVAENLASDRQLTGTAAAPTTSATATATPKAKSTPKPKATKTTPAKSGGTATAAGRSGAGVGRIQFGQTYLGQATFYGATGVGNCSFDASSDLMVGAMNQQDYDNAQACGAYLSVTGPKGTVKIRIVDRCPECPPGAIDLSQQAFAKIADVSAGRVSISWQLLSPDGLGSMSYRYKSGSSQYWCGIQVLNHRNPVQSLEVEVGGSWKTLVRQEYNYFLSAGGVGCGGTIRVTDIYGNQVTDSGIRIAPDQIQRGHTQFPAPSTSPPAAQPSPTPTQPTPTSTTTTPTGLTCTASTEAWSGGFVTSVTVSNGGSAAVTGWRARLSYDRAVAVSSAWGATATASGSTVTADPVSWTSPIGAAGTVSFGLQGSATGTAPTATCTVS